MELTVQNLVKQYPKKRALDDVSLERGRLWPSGS